MIDFNKWMLSLGINVDKQPPQQEAWLIAFEGMYDILIDLQKRIKHVEKWCP